MHDDSVIISNLCNDSVIVFSLLYVPQKTINIQFNLFISGKRLRRFNPFGPNFARFSSLRTSHFLRSFVFEKRTREEKRNVMRLREIVGARGGG